jgi:hypothetical protein
MIASSTRSTPTGCRRAALSRGRPGLA